MDESTEVKQEGVWALANITQNAMPHQYAILLEKGAIKTFASLLTLTASKALIVAMEGIENILKTGQEHFIGKNGENLLAAELEACGGVDYLEDLQLHKNHEVYERAVRILETYYNLEVGGEDDLMM